MRNPLLLSILLSAGFAAGNARAAVYQEVGGVVVVEGEHFDSRAAATDNDHHWVIAPDELTADDLGNPWGQYANARGKKYLVVLPDSAGGGENRNNADAQNAGPHADFKVQITTTGEYTLYVRDTGYDGSSDSCYFRIVELEKANGGPGPDWYRYNPTPADGDFDADRHSVGASGWDNQMTPEVNNAGGAEVAAVWTISKPGTYTIQIQQREDGNALDAIVLQRSNLPAPARDILESKIVGATPEPLKVTGQIPIPGATAAALTSPIQATFLDGTTTLDQSSVVVKLDGAVVTPTKTSAGGATTVSVTPAALFAPASTHTVSIDYKDNTGKAFNVAWTFTVQNYNLLAASQAVTADTSKKGFLVRTWKSPGEPNSIAWAEDQLAGLHGANDADTSTFTDKVFGNAYFDETGTINYWNTGGEGNFPNNATQNTPGLANDGTNDDSYTIEAIAYIDLPAGVVKMGVNSDDGFRVYAVQSPDPRDKFAMNLGQFDGGRGAADTTFQFVAEKAGVYPFRLVYEEGGGDSEVEWFSVTADGKKHLINDSTDAAALKAYRATTTPAGPIATLVTPGPSATGVSAVPAVEVDLQDSATQSVSASSVKMTFDGAAVTPTVTKTADKTVIKLAGSTVLAPLSLHTVSLTYNAGTTPVTRTWSFTVANYVTLTSAVDDSKMDRSKVGFLLRPYQIDGQNGTQPNTLAFTEEELAGKHGANIADLTGADKNGFFTVTGVINFDITGPDGHFVDPDYPDQPFPGFPGTGGGTDNTALELLTLLEFPASGYFTMGVNSDDGFRVQSAAPDPRGTNSVRLGQFDGGRGAADTFFSFYVPAAGVYPMRLIWENGGGGANLEWFTVQQDGSLVLVNDTKKAGALKAFQFQTLPVKQTTPPVGKFKSITLSNGKITIQWDGGGTLQTASNISGPWTDAANASSPFTASTSGARGFYRLKQ